jgi:hypothetical protein
VLLSRFWYFVLAVAAVSAAVATLLAQAAFDRRSQAALEDQLLRDRLEVELLLQVDARTRLDALAPIAAHPRVRSALAAANQAPDEVTDEAREALRNQLRTLNRQLDELAGDLVYATDGNGTILAQVGVPRPPSGASIGAFPLVERALAGYVRDDVWVFNDAVYRMAARPVIDGGRYVGALVHGQVVDDELAERLGSRLGEGATVVFFQSERIIAGHVATVPEAPRREAMGSVLREVLSGEAFGEGRRSDPVDLGGAEAVYSPVTGAAAAAGVGYGIARKKTVLSGPFAIFDRVTSDDVSSLPWAVLGVAAVLLFGLGVAFTWIERDRPLRLLASRLSALQGGAQDRLSIADYAGLVRRIADLTNQALDRTSAHAATKSGASAVAARSSVQDLDEILGPTPAPPSTPFFGFKTGLTDPPPAAGGGAPADAAPPGVNGTTPHGGPSGVYPEAPAAAAVGGQPQGAAGEAPAPAAPVAREPWAAESPGPSPSPAAPGPPPAPPPQASGTAGPRGGAPPPPLPGAPSPGPAPGAATAAISDGDASPTAAPPKVAKQTMVGFPQPAGAPGGPFDAPTPAPTAAPGAGGAPAHPFASPPEPAPRGGSPFATGPDGFEQEDEEGLTRVAPSPRELGGPPAAPAATGSDPEEAHFREVFQQFLEMKQRCGEPTANLTFEKFAQTLRKNKAALMEKHHAKGVRFTVYEKAGKAALKATPLRD